MIGMTREGAEAEAEIEIGDVVVVGVGGEGVGGEGAEIEIGDDVVSRVRGRALVLRREGGGEKRNLLIGIRPLGQAARHQSIRTQQLWHTACTTTPRKQGLCLWEG